MSRAVGPFKILQPRPIMLKVMEDGIQDTISNNCATLALKLNLHQDQPNPENTSSNKLIEQGPHVTDQFFVDIIIQTVMHHTEIKFFSRWFRLATEKDNVQRVSGRVKKSSLNELVVEGDGDAEIVTPKLTKQLMLSTFRVYTTSSIWSSKLQRLSPWLASQKQMCHLWSVSEGLLVSLWRIS